MIALTPFAFMKLNQWASVQLMPLALLTIWAMSLRVLLAVRGDAPERTAEAPASRSAEPTFAAA